MNWRTCCVGEPGKEQHSPPEIPNLKWMGERLAAEFLQSIDPSLLGRIRYHEGDKVVSPGRVKYVQRFYYWVRTNARRLEEAGLINGDRKRILELGSGSCLFAAMCRAIGHDIVATDKDRGDRIFTELSQLVGVEPGLLRVEPFRPLASGNWGRFDMLVAYSICFNQPAELPSGWWGGSEWSFFFRDVRQNVLAERGKVILKFNSEDELRPALNSQIACASQWHHLFQAGRTLVLQA